MKKIYWGVLPWACAIALWYGIRYTGLINPGLVPIPHIVAEQFWHSLWEDNLLIHIFMSTRRVLGGLFLGMALAIPVGFLIGWYNGIRNFLSPLINFFRALPPTALVPLVVVYLGIGETAKISILTYSVFFTAVIVMQEGIAQISPIYIRVARTLGATDFEVFWKVIVPLSVPHMLTGMRVGLGVGWATLVAAELVSAQEGLGAMIQIAGNYFNLDVIYVGIICIGVIALLMDVTLRYLTRRLVGWQESSGSTYG